MVWVDTPGPPWVRMNGCANTWNDVISVIVVAKKIAGVIIGQVTYRNRCSGPAPSICADSSCDCGTWSRAAEKTRKLEPKPCQTDIATIAGIAQVDEPRKFGALMPNQLCSPLSIRPPGWNISRQTITLATIGVITGMKNSTRNAWRPLIFGPTQVASPSDTTTFSGTYSTTNSTVFRTTRRNTGSCSRWV